MIVDIIWGFLVTIVTAILNALPAFTVGVGGWAADSTFQNAKNGAHDVGVKLATVRNIIDVQLLVTLFGIVLASFIVAATIKIILWVYDRLPGKAS